MLCSVHVLLAQTKSATGNIEIVKGAKQDNPTLVFEGGSTSDALNQKLLSDFKKCGWFTVVDKGAADYRVKVSGSVENFTIDLMNDSRVSIMSKRISGASDVDTVAHNAVDAVLENQFSIPGICRTKLAFSIAVSAKNKEIYVCDFDGANPIRMTQDNAISLEPQWMPDGKSLIYSYTGSNYTALKQRRFSSAGSAKENTRIVAQYSGMNGGGAISPDGKYVAMVLSLGNRVDLYVRALEGGSLTRLTNDKAVEASPCWSPDGSKICFVSDKSGRPVLYVISAKGGAATMITGLSGSERVSPDWSSDNQLAYCAKIGGSYQLAVAKINGSAGTMKQIGVTGKDVFPGENPSWAPDNRHIIMANSGSIYIVDTRLGTKRVPFTSQSQIVQPAWSRILK